MFPVNGVKEKSSQISLGNASFPAPYLQRKTLSRQSQVQQNHSHGWENLFQLVGTTQMVKLHSQTTAFPSKTNGVVFYKHLPKVNR